MLGLLDRASLLRRRAAGGDDVQLLAANLDLVLLACGLDRPVTAGRIQRGEALAWDAGAHPLLVLTKADLSDGHGGGARPGSMPSTRASSAWSPRRRPPRGSTSCGSGSRGHTSVLLGESGAGKSRLVNAVLGSEAAVVGAVRTGDAKGRHTTTNRQLHELAERRGAHRLAGHPRGGAGGRRGVGRRHLRRHRGPGDECHFTDCTHDGEPGCAVALAVAAGELAQERVDAYADLRSEAASAARRADEHERRAYERRFTKAVKAHVKNKPNNRP